MKLILPGFVIGYDPTILGSLVGVRQFRKDFRYEYPGDLTGFARAAMIYRHSGNVLITPYRCVLGGGFDRIVKLLYRFSIHMLRVNYIVPKRNAII